MSQTFLTTHNLEFTIDFHKILFKDVSLSIQAQDRIGLVGKNGSGKSTLLKILSKQIAPTNGTVNLNLPIFYLEQLDLNGYKSEERVYEFIEEKYQNWWEVIIKFKELFLSEIDENASLKNLSGGEFLKLNLAIGLVQNPDILLLDEPTNHLDTYSREILLKSIQDFKRAVVIASHDVKFLDKSVTKIWEIENESIRAYGGNYSEYQRIKQTEEDARFKKYKAKEKEIVKIAKSKQIEQEYHQKAIAKSKQLLKMRDRSMTRSALRSRIGRGETLHGNYRKEMNEIMDEKFEDLDKLTSRKQRKIYLDLSNTNKKQKDLLLQINNGLLKINDNLQIKKIFFELRYGERVLINGKNGSGKTSFIKSLLENSYDDFYKTGNLKTAIVDQKFDLVNTNLDVYENISSYNKNLSDEQIRKQLGNFLFISKEDVVKKIMNLSGGELARLTFAMVTSIPIDVLILDEPTNNLDIETKDTIMHFLKEFKGSIILITHDDQFAKELGMGRIYAIENMEFKMKS